MSPYLFSITNTFGINISFKVDCFIFQAYVANNMYIVTSVYF